jgi:hypothetical protein
MVMVALDGRRRAVPDGFDRGHELVDRNRSLGVDRRPGSGQVHGRRDTV